ncbi:hypothetical protein AN639_10925 [Candidatus Epulonipiscium fishelsonii]|uniref:Uncharacterized protein n=1 Tax=Candidatus Epulonipiscium fishelsonii TaxID=77094 RepID=A0ACC8XCN9_9FIRM|nr:hypothetical protein AN396_05750 [Epulopiscium sp. SCG-B11WGA-EpuloA1]ONI43186.1 hypothetical protein AN639_10925 [Epulopiscium sp. SCG-B05WGA-EpuloA1]ONI46995.1 hypothetical protein AN644_02045 [Epulopiscium sp. SCG-C06WGA-EpuloA1]
MKKANFILSGICSAISIYVISVALTFPAGKDGVPGPGVFPIIISILMLAACVAIIFSSLKMEDIKIPWKNSGAIEAYISMIAVVAYIVILGQVGFVVTSVIFMTLMVQWFQKGSPIKNAVISVVFVGLVYLVFSEFLNVPMNFGILI